MYYPCTFCTCAKHKSAVVNHRRRPLPPQSQLYPSQMYYPCTFCTCAKYKSAVFTAGVLAAFPPMALSCSPLSCLPACLPAARSHRASPSPAVKSEPTSPCISPHVLGSWKPGDDLHTMLRPQESEQHPCFALKRASSR